MGSREAEEIRSAFGEIAKGIDRLGFALAAFVESGQEGSEKIGRLIEVVRAPSSGLVASVEEDSKAKKKSKRPKTEQEIVESEESSTIQPITAPPTPSTSKGHKPLKVRDPNAPKKPMSSYLLFCRDHREKLMKENPRVHYLEITKLLGQMWEKADKKQYEEEAHKLNEKYKAEAAQYIQSKANDTVPLTSAAATGDSLEDQGKDKVEQAEAENKSELPKVKKSKKEKKKEKSDFSGEKGPLVPIPPLPVLENSLFAPSSQMDKDQKSFEMLKQSKKKKNKSEKVEA